jgi:hypothetical protein
LKPSLRLQKFETSAAQTFNCLVAVDDWHVMMVIWCSIKILWLRGLPPLEMVGSEWGFETATWNGWNGDGLKPSFRRQKFETSAAQTFNYLVAVSEYDIIKVISHHIKVLWLSRGHHRHLKWWDQWGFETATWNGWNSDGLKPSLRWQKFETSAAQTFNLVIAGDDWHVMTVIPCSIKVLWLRGYHHLKWLDQW